MIESSNAKKNLFYIVVLVLTLVTMIIGATLAYFSMIASQKNEGTVLYTGKLEINYIDGVYLKNPELIPIREVTYETYNNVYRNNFSVRSSGTIDQTLSIDMIITKNDFNDGDLKYAVYNSQGTQLASGIILKTGTINLANNMFLSHDGIANYSLIIWLDNTDSNQNYEMGSVINGKINVYAEQIKY